MESKEMVAALDIMARAIYGDDAWIGYNKVTGYSVWWNSRDVALTAGTFEEVKAFLVAENQINQARFNDALKKIGG